MRSFIQEQQKYGDTIKDILNSIKLHHVQYNII